jgi:predicted DsbA family dithiol-disulfide isomerase
MTRLSHLAANPGSTVELIADPSCPWCHIGFRRLVRLQQATPLVIRWRPFLLNPYLPAEGIEREAYAGRKFGSPEAGRRLDRRIAEIGRAEGIELAFERIARTPSAIGPHLLLLEAQRQGRLVAGADLVFRTFFADGGDIGDPALLARLADRLSLATPTEPLTDAAVLASHRAATASGVNGVPVFVFAGGHTVAGAQPIEVLAAMLDLARYQASLAADAPLSR